MLQQDTITMENATYPDGKILLQLQQVKFTLSALNPMERSLLLARITLENATYPDGKILLQYLQVLLTLSASDPTERLLLLVTMLYSINATFPAGRI